MLCRRQGAAQAFRQGRLISWRHLPVRQGATARRNLRPVSRFPDLLRCRCEASIQQRGCLSQSQLVPLDEQMHHARAPRPAGGNAGGEGHRRQAAVDGLRLRGVFLRGGGPRRHEAPAGVLHLLKVYSALPMPMCAGARRMSCSSEDIACAVLERMQVGQTSSHGRLHHALVVLQRLLTYS